MINQPQKIVSRQSKMTLAWALLSAVMDFSNLFFPLLLIKRRPKNPFCWRNRLSKRLPRNMFWTKSLWRIKKMSLHLSHRLLLEKSRLVRKRLQLFQPTIWFTRHPDCRFTKCKSESKTLFLQTQLTQRDLRSRLSLNKWLILFQGSLKEAKLIFQKRTQLLPNKKLFLGKVGRSRRKSWRKKPHLSSRTPR